MLFREHWKKKADLEEECYLKCAAQDLLERKRALCDLQKHVFGGKLSQRDAQKTMDDYDYEYLAWFGQTRCERVCFSQFRTNWIPGLSRFTLDLTPCNVRFQNDDELCDWARDPRRPVGALMGTDQDIYPATLPAYEDIRTRLLKAHDFPGFWTGAGGSYFYDEQERV